MASLDEDLMNAIEALTLCQSHLAPAESSLVKSCALILKQVLNGERRKKKVKVKAAPEAHAQEWDDISKLFDAWETTHIESGRTRPAAWHDEDKFKARQILRRLKNHPDPLAEAIRR